MSYREVHHSGRPAVEDGDRDVGEAVAKSIHGDLLRALRAEGQIPGTEAEDIANTIEADMVEQISAHFDERGDFE